MYKQCQLTIYSPSDLTTFMSSPFASWMNRYKLEEPDNCPEHDEQDDFITLLADKGIQHEEDLLDEFVKQGLNVVSISDGDKDDFDTKAKATEDAMRNGVDVIFQATLEKSPFRGYADFLVKVDGASLLGDYHYEVWDTKLATRVKPYFIIQLCCYAEMLHEIQGEMAKDIVVALGNGVKERLRLHDYYYYYLSLKSRFIAFQGDYEVSQMPDPADSKEYGRWTTYAEQLLTERNHLSLIANISHSQIKKLNNAGITTCHQLIEHDGTYVSGLKPSILDRLKAQATIQHASAGKETPAYEVLVHEHGVRMGLSLLPPHSDNDVFFDIEGFPLIEGGLEYLWGCTYFDEGGRTFKDYWAHDCHQEKQAFQDFIQWVYERWQSDPSMHIYHYAHYEIAACRKLMGRYGVCEHEVDQLLRNEVFVDLYKVVKGGLLVGASSYSIKKVEHLYRGQRETSVGQGDDSVVVYERWREGFKNGEEGADWQSSTILSDIRDYNIDDCDSTQELAAWLRERQTESHIPYIPKAQIVEPDISEEVSNRIELRDRLLEKSSRENEPAASLTANMAWLLEFHRRESKPIFWRLFDRLGLEPDELVDDIDCLAGCVRTDKEPYLRAARVRNLAYEYTFDIEQEFKANAKSYYLLGVENEEGGPQMASLLNEDSDFLNGIVTLSARHALPHEVSLIPNEYVRPGEIPAAIDDVVSRYENNALENSAIHDFLMRRPPRIQGKELTDTPIITEHESEKRLEQVINVVNNMDNSYLTIQGPPGTGKTYTGKHIIAELLRRGKKVGISSNSHKAINNLLVGVASTCREVNIQATCVCTKDTGPEIEANGIEVTQNNLLSDYLEDGSAVGATAWGFCREDMEEALDYLFVDEAGQVSVANLVGMSRSADNIVLMGDQMQLGQPSQGSHPGDSGLSVLDYLLHESPIIPPNMGVFLDITYRMHPAVNEYISHAIYEGQLHTNDNNKNQRICLSDSLKDDGLKEAGVVFIASNHEGNTQASDEEVDLILDITNKLMGCELVDNANQQRPISHDDILIVAPYNHQVNKLKKRLGSDYRVGSIDKFQGQEAPIIFYSLCASEVTEGGRGIDFMYDRHRINVAISRAKTLAIVVGNPGLFNTEVSTVEQMAKVNVLARLQDYL